MVTRRRPSFFQCQAEMMDHTVETIGPSRPWDQRASGKSFSKDPSAAPDEFAPEAANGGESAMRRLYRL